MKEDIRCALEDLEKTETHLRKTGDSIDGMEAHFNNAGYSAARRAAIMTFINSHAIIENTQNLSRDEQGHLGLTFSAAAQPGQNGAKIFATSADLIAFNNVLASMQLTETDAKTNQHVSRLSLTVNAAVLQASFLHMINTLMGAETLACVIECKQAVMDKVPVRTEDARPLRSINAALFP